MRVRLSWFINSRLEGLPASSRYLLLALETYCHARDTRGSITVDEMNSMATACCATIGDIAHLSQANIIAFDGTEYFLFGFEESYDHKLQREVESVLAICDANPEQYHWRSHLESIEQRTQPRYRARWRMKVLEAWLNGDNPPALTGGTRKDVYVRTKSKIDMCADEMLRRIDTELQTNGLLIECNS